MEVVRLKTIQKGLWRRGKDGEFKPLIRGCVQLDGTVVEVVSRDGNRTYVEITGTYEKIRDGYLYEFKHTHRPKSCTGISTGVYDIDLTKVNSNVGGLVSMEELDKALGLTN